MWDQLNKWCKLAVWCVVAVVVIVSVFLGGWGYGTIKFVAPSPNPASASASVTSAAQPVPTSTPVVNNNFTIVQSVNGIPAESSLAPLPPPTLDPDCKVFGVQATGRYKLTVDPCDVELFIDGQRVRDGQVVYLTRGWHNYWSISSKPGLKIDLID